MVFVGHSGVGLANNLQYPYLPIFKDPNWEWLETCSAQPAAGPNRHWPYFLVPQNVTMPSTSNIFLTTFEGPLGTPRSADPTRWPFPGPSEPSKEVHHPSGGSAMGRESTTKCWTKQLLLRGGWYNQNDQAETIGCLKLLGTAKL